jgi:hypothetical protein
VSNEKQDPPASAGTSNRNNAANSPTEPRLTFQYWNYYAPYLNENSNWAENGIGRILIPFQVDCFQQILHVVRRWLQIRIRLVGRVPDLATSNSTNSL